MSGASELDVESLYSEYQAAIKSGVIEDILRIGGLYFNALRNGEISEEDREQLQKDVLICAVRKEDV